jgi:hypothetical protein
MSWNKRNNRNNMHGATIKIIIYIVNEHDLKLVAFPNGIKQAGQET